MNRDALIATLIGFGIGLLITGIILVGPAVAKNIPSFKFPTITMPAISLPSFPRFGSKPMPSPTPTPSAAAFSIDAPLADSIESQDTVTVSGRAPAATVVIVGGHLNEAAVKTSEGTYAAEISLVEGKNDLTVTAVSDTFQQSLTVVVYYTPEEF